MRIARATLTALLVLGGSACDAEAAGRPNWLVEREDVASVLAKVTNSELEVTRMEVLGEPVALVPHPELQIDSWRRNPPLAALEFRLRCVRQSQCGAFLVRVSSTSAEPNKFAVSGNARRPGAHARSTAGALVRQGRPAKMAVRGDGFRLWVPVMCLQSGGLGDRIRVRDRCGRRLFVAKVVGPAEVEAPSE